MLSQNIEITIDDPDNHESFVVVADKRHGKTGWRVLRYTETEIEDAFEWRLSATTWDEQYMFFVTFDEILTMIETRDFKPGQMAF